MTDPSRDNLVFLLETIQEQRKKSTKPDVFAEVEKRTKLKLRRMYEKTIMDDRQKWITPVVEMVK